jgi:hypothetical protein
MLTYLRYALATFCFAASVGCLGLWEWSHQQRITCQVQSATKHSFIEARGGYLTVHPCDMRASSVGSSIYTFWSKESQDTDDLFLSVVIANSGMFGVYHSLLHFPLWYPALIFALAGVGILRLGRRFTIRSAIIATTVVAGLLGMAVIL